MRCRTCGANIRFIKTKNGKAMPADPDVVRYVLGGNKRLITGKGEVVACRYAEEREPCDGVGFVPHFATCKGGRPNV